MRFPFDSHERPTIQDQIILLAVDDTEDEAATLRILHENGIVNEIAVTRTGIETLEYLLGRRTETGVEAGARPQMILLDLKHSRLNNMEVLRRLRADERTKFLPVIVLTSSHAEEEAIAEQRFRAKNVVRKPLEYKEFCNAIRDLGLSWKVMSLHHQVTES